MKCLCCFFVCCLLFVIGIPIVLFIAFNKPNWANHPKHIDHPLNFTTTSTTTTTTTTLKPTTTTSNEEIGMEMIEGSINGDEEAVVDGARKEAYSKTGNRRQELMNSSSPIPSKDAIDSTETMGDKRGGKTEKLIGGDENPASDISNRDMESSEIKGLKTQEGTDAHISLSAEQPVGTSDKKRILRNDPSGEIIEEEEEEIVVKKTKKPSKTSSSHQN